MVLGPIEPTESKMMPVGELVNINPIKGWSAMPTGGYVYPFDKGRIDITSW